MVVDATVGLGEVDGDIIEILKNKNIPYLIFINKTDLVEKSEVEELKDKLKKFGVDVVVGSALNKEGTDKIIDFILAHF